MPLWVAFPSLYGAGKRQKVEWREEWFPYLDKDQLNRWRKRAKELYQQLYPEHREHVPLGFVPSLIAHPVAEESGIRFQTDFDSKMFQMAIVLPVKVAEGTWESGPGKWSKPLPSPFPPPLYSI